MLRTGSFEALMKIIVQKVNLCFVAAAIPFVDFALPGHHHYLPSRFIAIKCW